MNKTSPLLKGAITGVLMLAVTLTLFYTLPPTSNLHYIVYAVYAGGIAWTLLDYFRSAEYSGKFGHIFNKGFRCFVIVTLIMVTFVGTFSSMHPEFAEEDAKLYRQYLIEQKNNLPAEIDSMVALEKKYYTVKTISMSAFGFLITGSIFTAAGAGLLLMRRK